MGDYRMYPGGLVYEPPLEEIRTECEKIQAGWSPIETLRRQYLFPDLTDKELYQQTRQRVSVVNTSGIYRGDRPDGV